MHAKLKGAGYTGIQSRSWRVKLTVRKMKPLYSRYFIERGGRGMDRLQSECVNAVRLTEHGERDADRPGSEWRRKLIKQASDVYTNPPIMFSAKLIIA
ncbi:uncharacterized protein LOC105204059 [Solenopsis invicta]|uniref:uncharacterized protein LOC105204059 n=1 Tax=Solenopsis invicta TaxID=13686 RepID=UPI00193D189B|nr:uncharacterized protein LOC105204059 [Solenopsis invicta]